jgi:calcium-dependent protein kinase
MSTFGQKDPLRDENILISPSMFVLLRKNSIRSDYTLGKELGSGAYGRVLKVTHNATGIVRAAKCIKKKKNKVGVTQKENKVINEAKILKGLDHPNICKLIEHFQDNQFFYLVTEYCAGGELFDRIQKFDFFSEEQASAYMQQLLSALVYCHDLKVMHRDLKPENILLQSNDLKSQIKVIDFGVATTFEPGEMRKDQQGTVTPS